MRGEIMYLTSQDKYKTAEIKEYSAAIVIVIGPARMPSPSRDTSPADTLSINHSDNMKGTGSASLNLPHDDPIISDNDISAQLQQIFRIPNIQAPRVPFSLTKMSN
jgi:hypothetical protein